MTVSTPSVLFESNYDSKNNDIEGGEVYTLAARHDLAESSWEPMRRRGKTRRGKRSQVRVNLQAHVGGDR